MDLQEAREALALDPLIIGNWVRDKEQRGSDEPAPRRYHSAVVHKSSLFVYGGVPSLDIPQAETEQSIAYRFNFNAKMWSRNQTHFLSNNSFSFIYGHSTAVYNNMMYLFGGRNYKTGGYLTGLWCLNLQSFNWKRQELKGYIPAHRQNGVMILHQRSLLLLYGGRYQSQNLNDFHIYRIDNKMWLQVEQNSYDLRIPCRLKPALCSLGDHIYLFGGERRLAQGNVSRNELLKDFYQLKLINRPMSSRPDVWVKEVITNYSPSERASTLINLADRYLVLWGGLNAIDSKKGQFGFWVYVVADINWIWVSVPGTQPRSMLPGWSMNYQSQKFYLFGECEEESSPSRSSFSVLSIEFKQLQSRLSDLHFRPKMLEGERQCWECNEQHHSLEQLKFNDFCILEEMLEDEMIFPFTAFGLLMDNALIIGAKDTQVIFGHSNKDKFILIMDNGSGSKLWINNSEFINDLLFMRTYVEESIDQLDEEDREEEGKKNFMPESPVHHPMNILNKQTREQKEIKQKEAKDKEMEKELKKRKKNAKQNARKRKEDRIEYSRNIKIGSLRLGNRVIFISRYGSGYDNRRVFVIERNEQPQGHPIFRAYYYIYENGALTDPLMESPRKYIDQEYKNYLKMAGEHKESNNFLFVAQLKQRENEKGEMEPELKESNRHGDIFNCDRKQLEGLEEGLLWDCIDVSLKTYLSLLYLKSDEIKITLVIGDYKPQEISNDEILKRIDQLLKSDRLLDLQPALDLSNCNIIEAYYNKGSSRSRQPNRKAFHFLNGVLFYHKNRLVSRYRFTLGQISQIFRNRAKSAQQTLLMFGFIQIKDQFQVNIFKTAFVRDDLLEEIYHRLKFVEQYADKMTREESRRPQEEKPEPKKRFRANEDKDEAYQLQ